MARFLLSESTRRAAVTGGIAVATMTSHIAKALTINSDVLDSDEEPAIDPTLAIVDAHHHIWETPPAVAGLAPYEMERLIVDKARSGHNIIATVYVQAFANCRSDAPVRPRCTGETAYIENIARIGSLIGGAGKGICAGIVGFADLLQGERVEHALEEHIAISPKRFRGIRYITAWSAEHRVPWDTFSGMMYDSNFRAGFRQLARKNLSFDAYIFHSQMPDLIDLAKKFPNTVIVLDHLGSPLGVGSGAALNTDAKDVWRKSMAALSKCENVFVKLGGTASFLRERRTSSLEMATLSREYYLPIIDLFTPQRCMFESNFPVERGACSYGAVWNTYKRITVDFSFEEKQSLFRDTAQRVYGLTDI